MATPTARALPEHALDHPPVRLSRINDLTSSIWNRTSSAVCFHDRANTEGKGLLRLSPGEWSADIGRAANKKISTDALASTA